MGNQSKGGRQYYLINIAPALGIFVSRLNSTLFSTVLTPSKINSEAKLTPKGAESYCSVF
jgi:hypothetical protein